MRVVIASTPAAGHINPVAAIGRILVADDHEVIGLSGNALTSACPPSDQEDWHRTTSSQPLERGGPWAEMMVRAARRMSQMGSKCEEFAAWGSRLRVRWGVLGAAWPQPPGTSLTQAAHESGTLHHRARDENSVFFGFTLVLSMLRFLEPGEGETAIQRMMWHKPQLGVAQSNRTSECFALME
jgi:hypothetical protein